MLTRVKWLIVKSEISTELGLRNKFSEFLGWSAKWFISDDVIEISAFFVKSWGVIETF
jgi:hypothetical protein